MTREKAIIEKERKKAIKVLDDMKVKIDIPKAAKTQNDRNWALDMAIKTLEQEPCGESMNKTYQFGKNRGVGVYWNKQTDTVELPEAVFRYILSLVPTE